MRKILMGLLGLAVLVACDKHDPILPGVRTAVFDSTDIVVSNKSISDIPTDVIQIDNSNCKYTQDKSNTIWNGNKKIFSGFATANSVAGNRTPICSGKYVYAGLTTGELIKINSKNRQIIWIADIYRASNLTGGASVVDIVAPIIPYKNAVYVGGLGDAFCKVNANSGNKQWCVDISVPVPFIITGQYAFVVSGDKYLNAIATTNGEVLWRTQVAKISAPKLENGIIRVGKQQVNIADGKIIK